MNGHAVVRFIVAIYDCAEDENRKGGRSTLIIQNVKYEMLNTRQETLAAIDARQQTLNTRH